MSGPLVQPLWELKHYYAFTEPRPMPTDVELRHATNNAHGPTGAQHVVFAIMASCELSHRLRVADVTWCSPHHGQVRCYAYVDCEEFPSGAFRPANVGIVPASQYLPTWHAPHDRCCNGIDFRSSRWDGFGPSSFYCRGRGRHAVHLVRTLAAQYRFMPALQHAKANHMREDTRWVALVDDDSWVSLPRLLQVLSAHNHRHPTQLGDFIKPNAVNDTHWRRPFACGGAGYVLSRGAMRTIDWRHCMRQFGGSCLQSDWMIGRCIEATRVTAITGLACGTCLAKLSFAVSSHSKKLRRRLLEGQCAFAQLPMGEETMRLLFGPADQMTYGLYLLARPAISHWSESPFLKQPTCVPELNASSSATAHAKSGNGHQPADSSAATWPLMLVGAQKAATTSLYSRLAEHPDFCPSKKREDEPIWYAKEKHFFDHASRCNAGVGWYRSLFPTVGSPARRDPTSVNLFDGLNGGGNPSCGFHVDSTPLVGSATSTDGGGSNLLVASRVFYTIPVGLSSTAKLIAVLREPATRTFSWYKHLYRVAEFQCTIDCEGWSCSVLKRCAKRCAPNIMDAHGKVECHILPPRPTLPFWLWVALIGPETLPSSVYAPQVLLWRQYFGSGLLLLTFDEMLAQPEASLRAVAAHAGLRPFPEAQIRPLDTKHAFKFQAKRAAAAAARAAAEVAAGGGHHAGNGSAASTPASGLEIQCSMQRQLLSYFEPHVKVLRRQEPGLGQLLPGSCSDNVPLEQRAPPPKGRSEMIFVNDRRRRNEMRAAAARRKKFWRAPRPARP